MSTSLYPGDLKHLRGNVELLRARTNALKRAETLDPRLMKYGLGIASSLPDDFKSGYLGGEARYDASASGSVAILPWGEAMKDSEISNVAGLRLAVSDTYGRNYHFASMFGNFGGGRVVRGEDGGQGEVVLRAEYEESAADVVFIWAPRGARIQITEESKGGAPFAGRTLAIFAEEDAHIEISSIKNFSNATISFANAFVHILRGASVSFTDISLGSRFGKSDVSCFLIEEGARALVSGVSLAANQAHDIFHTMSHMADGTRSEIRMRGIAGSQGKIIYRGDIDIRKGVSRSRGEQEGKFLHAGINAEIDAIPSLDIGSGASISSHSLSISHLSEKDFFYPGIRGMPPFESQAMLFEGFLSQGAGNDSLKGMLREKLQSAIYHAGRE